MKENSSLITKTLFWFQYAKLARDLQVPGGVGKKSESTAPSGGGAGNGEKGAAPDEEEDDLSGLL